MDKSTYCRKFDTHSNEPARDEKVWSQTSLIGYATEDKEVFTIY